MTLLQREDVTIANGATTSSEVNLRDKHIVAIELPAAFTGTAITFTSVVQPDDLPGDKTFQAVQDGAGVAVSITVAQAKYVTLTQAQNFATQGMGRTKLVSGSSEGAARVVTLVLLPLP